MDETFETPGSLRLANQELQHRVQELQAALQRAEEKAAIAQKASVDAWPFAKVLSRRPRSSTT